MFFWEMTKLSTQTNRLAPKMKQLPSDQAIKAHPGRTMFGALGMPNIVAHWPLFGAISHESDHGDDCDREIDCGAEVRKAADLCTADR